MAEKTSSRWESFRAWLPTIFTICSLIAAGAVFGFRVDWRVKDNTRRSKDNQAAVKQFREEVIPELRKEQGKIREKLTEIHTVQRQQGRGLENLNKKVDKILDRMINGTGGS